MDNLVTEKALIQYGAVNIKRNVYQTLKSLVQSEGCCQQFWDKIQHIWYSIL